jgi:uroporphyrinogen-III synthase
MKPLIILRPEPGASATAAAARDLEIEPIVMPLFKVERLPWQAPDPAEFDGLLLTSANAIRHGGEQMQRLRGLKAYCVGEATAAVAREGGFDVAAVGKSDVRRLLSSIEGDLRLVHPSGEDRTDLGDTGRNVRSIAVYRAAALPVPDCIGRAQGAVVAIHSQRSARRFADIADCQSLDRSAIAIAGISEVVTAAAGDGWLELRAAHNPDDPSLLALARSLCNTSTRS